MQPSADADHHDDDFLSRLDLRHAEDQSMRICAKCGKPVGEDDYECPWCGMDARTGQMTAIARKKSMIKGPDPDEFNGTALREPWKFAFENKSLWLRSMLYTTIMGLLFTGCMYMAWMVSSRLPPKTFWSGFAFITALVLPGWYWHLLMLTIQRTMSKKTDLGTVHFDMFQNMALGLKIIIWSFVFYGIPGLIPGIPLLILTYFFGWKVLLFLTPIVVLLFPFQLVGVCHLAMPVTKRGWVSPLMIRPFFKTIGRSLFVWMLLFAINIVPVAMIAGGLVIVEWNRNKPYFAYYEDPRVDIKALEEEIKEKYTPDKKDNEEKRKQLKEGEDKIKARIKEIETPPNIGDEKLTAAWDKVKGFRNLDWTRPKFADENVMAAYDARWSWWLWMVLACALIYFGMLAATLTVVVSNRLIAQYAYFFNEPLELVTEPPEEEFVRMLPARPGALLGLAIAGFFIPFVGVILKIVGGWWAVVGFFMPMTGSFMSGLAVRLAKIDLEDMKTGRRDPKGRKSTKLVVTFSLLISIFWAFLAILLIMSWSFGFWFFAKSE